MTYCHRGTKGRKGQNITFRLAIIQRYCLCYCVLTIYFLKIALSLGASYGDKCVITSLLLEIPRKIFCDSEGWTEHACTGSRRAMVYTEPTGTCWGGGERLLLQGRGQSWVLSGDMRAVQRGAWGMGLDGVLSPPEAQLFLSRWCTGFSFGSNG